MAACAWSCGVERCGYLQIDDINITHQDGASDVQELAHVLELLGGDLMRSRGGGDALPVGDLVVIEPLGQPLVDGHDHHV